MSSVIFMQAQLMTSGCCGLQAGTALTSLSGQAGRCGPLIYLHTHGSKGTHLEICPAPSEPVPSQSCKGTHTCLLAMNRTAWTSSSWTCRPGIGLACLVLAHCLCLSATSLPWCCRYIGMLQLRVLLCSEMPYHCLALESFLPALPCPALPCPALPCPALPCPVYCTTKPHI